MNITVDIRIKPYLQEFYECMLGMPIQASKKNLIGPIIYPHLETPPKKLPEKNPKYNYMTVELVDFENKRIEYKNYISEFNQPNIASLLHNLFKEIFFKFVDARMEAGFNKKTSIFQFCERYNVSYNQVNYENLKKKHDRYVKELKKNKKSLQKNHQVLSRSLSQKLTLAIIL
ncbi:MAG: hypothetical protein JEY96_01595 [Bacteroidales bacterium]|nr:hypothetical protein [Bacteroidales bacterium]